MILQKTETSGMDECLREQMNELIARLRQLQQTGDKWQATIHGQPNGEMTLSITLYPPLKRTKSSR